MRDDPKLDNDKIAACLDAWYGLRLDSLEFRPIGHDMYSAVYNVVANRGALYFLKIRSGPVHEPGLLAARALFDLGINHVLAPLPNRAGSLWSPLDERGEWTVVLYPFIHGEDAKAVGLTDDQWRQFGRALRAVHAGGLQAHFRGLLRTETFALPSAELVRTVLAATDAQDFASPTATMLAAFLRENAARIEFLLARAEELGRSLQLKPFDLVLCHGDIHAANILINTDEQLRLIDWDGPLIAPRERDLLFIVGSRIARPVAPGQEDLFFEGYGPTEINPAVLSYYRYERIVEDLGEFGKTVFLDQFVSEQTRGREAALAMGFFALDGDIERAELIPRTKWPSAPV